MIHAKSPRSFVKRKIQDIEKVILGDKINVRFMKLNILKRDEEELRRWYIITSEGG